MERPCLYQKANEMQRHDAEQIIKEYSHMIQWRHDGSDALLDIGSGSGDVLMDFVYTIMPDTFEKFVGTDVSLKMVNFAQDFYKSYKKCEFRVLDIGTEKPLPSDLVEQFDHVTSFYCLHWVHNKKQALRNIYQMLKAKGGDCLLVFLASNPVYDVYNLISKSNKWCQYMQDVDQYINPMHYSKDPKNEFISILTEEGFSDIHVDVKRLLYTYESQEIFKENIKAINPFLDRMPASLHDNFLNDLIDTAAGMGIKQSNPLQENGYVFTLPYQLIVAYAKKRPQSATGSSVWKQ